ncbi:MAG TPA: class I SAM-dependent methyltransferase [Pirellulales bacterium]|nr:class I SAM-dependent methyltransferase [Pirellulales bacterium]
MDNVPDKERFRAIYDGKPPWDIGKPQPAFVEVADQIVGSVLDVGCGTGENALFFAARGRRVTGVDFLEQPLADAKRKAHERGLDATFLLMDALHLQGLSESFDSIIDCGLFHVFSDDDRASYVTSLGHVAKPGTRLFLACFSDKEPPGDGPRRVSQAELRAAFSEGWLVESIHATRFEIRPDRPDLHFSPEGPYAWFCVVRRL